MMLRIQRLLLLLVSATSFAHAEINEGDIDHAPPSRISQRRLNWDALNNLIYNAVLRFPDSDLATEGLNMKITNLQCTNVRVGNINMRGYQENLQSVVAKTDISGLELNCRANYEFWGWLIVSGSGDLYVESRNNRAITEIRFTSPDYNNKPPYDSSMSRCDPTINLDRIDFNNGGFWGWTLNALENLFRGRFEELAQQRLCDELRAMTDDSLDQALADMTATLNQYPPQTIINPLASETALLQNQVALQAALLPTSTLINWQAPDSYTFGFFMDEAWRDMVAFLNKRVLLPNGSYGLNANLLLQQNILTNGVLVMDITDPAQQMVYENHDLWMKTTIRAYQVRIRGLDTMTTVDPMVVVGQHTLQSKVSWQSLYLEVDLAIDISPSTQPNSYITNGGSINERVTVQFSLYQVTAVLSVLLALDQEDIEALEVGHFLQKDNILPCFLSSIHNTEVSTLSVEAYDLQPPRIYGFVSEGLDSLISTAISTWFLMYKSSLLIHSKAFFQLAVREVLNESIRAEQDSYGAARCVSLDLPPPYGIIDARDLLLEPAVSIERGGAGLQRYGDLFSAFVVPTLQKEVLTDDNINERFLRPLTLDQSGQEGVIDTSIDGNALLDIVQTDPNATTWVSLLGWERFQLQSLGAKVENVDTVTSPVDVLNPITGKLLSNTLQTGIDTPDRPLRLSMRVSANGLGRVPEVKDMYNEVELSISIPSTQMAADVLVAMNESSLLNFPLKDLDNEFCWLATLRPGANHSALSLEMVNTTMSSFSVGVSCVTCSSPGGLVLPVILQTMTDAGLTTSFQPYLELLLAEVISSTWDNMNFASMIQDAPKLCPHHESYDANATASDSYGAANAMVAPPQWSTQSVETIASIGFLSVYASLFVVATNHLMQPEQPELQLPPVGEVTPQGANASSAAINRAPADVKLLDWTDLSLSLGRYANDVFDEAREALTISVSDDDNVDAGLPSAPGVVIDDSFNESSIVDGSYNASILEGSYNASSSVNSSNVTRRLDFFGSLKQRGQSRRLQATSFIKDNLLDEDGSLVLEFDDLQIDFAGINFSFTRAQVFGIDSITQLDPLIVVAPQTLQNNVQLQHLNVSLDLGVAMGEVKSNLTVGFSFLDVALELPLLLALDLDKMGMIELGSLMRVSQIFPCLLEGAHEVFIPSLKLTIGTMEEPSISSTMSRELHSAVLSISGALFNAFGNDLAIALPGLFDTTLRRTLNTWLDQYVRQVDPTLCTVDAGGDIVDFRDLFLPRDTAKSLGGSGMQQYGDLFVTLHNVMRDELTTKAGELPAFNDVLASWTAEQSGVSGTLQFPGDLVNTTANMVLLGLNATLGMKLSDIYLENIDTLGSPLALLDPLDAITLDNTASFGVGPDPLRVTARLLLSLSDNEEMQVRNDVTVSTNIYEATAAATVLLRIAEDAFLKFPLKDITNLYCWISTIVSSTEEVYGISLTDHALRLQEMDINVSCISCTSPQFGELIADLYSPSDGEEATDTVIQTLGQVLNGEAIQDYLDQIVRESSSQCPHSSDYSPESLMTASQYLQNQAKPLGFTDFTTRDNRSAYFNIASAIFAAFLFVSYCIGKLIVSRKNRKWKDSLSNEGMFLLRRQKAKEKEQEEAIDMYSTSLFRSPHIPRSIRWLVPIALLLNIGLYLGGHLGVLSTVDVEVHLAGEDFTVHNFMVFSFFDSAANTYRNGGIEMSIMLWIFTGIWPYVKTVASLFLWFVPPQFLSVSTRGKLLLWIDTLTKLSIIDIFATIVFVAVLLVYIGGPDEALNADGALYSMKIIVVPGASCYCIVIAQRMSRVSSRFFLDYQDQVVAGAREACLRGDITNVYKKQVKQVADGSDPPPIANQLTKSTAESSSLYSMSRRQEEEQKEEANSVRSEAQEVSMENEYGATVDMGDYKLPPEEHELNVHVNNETEDAASSLSGEQEPISWLLRLRLLGGHLGVAFGALTVLVLAIIGCIYAPSVAFEVSDLWGLALEAETTFEEAATQYGVFTVVSAVLLKARFVLDTTWDYVALGFLLSVAFVSVGMVFFVGCYHFLKRLLREGWSAIKPNKHSSTFELPSYLSLHAYKHIEIYVVAVVIGCWQLGSVSIYAIHLYCSILDAVYRVLTYIGLAQASSAQCFEAQMTIVDNLCVFFGALLILLGNFCIQSSKQCTKNIQEACDLLRHEDNDVEHLSSLWNSPSKPGFWKSSRHLALNRTATFSSDYSRGEASSYKTAKSSAPIAFVPYCPLPGDQLLDDSLSTSTISGSPSAASASGLLFSGSIPQDYKVVASVDQYSTPQ